MLPKLEFGVLGTLSVRADDRAITVSSAKLRIVLARLLVEAGRPVSLDKLIRAVWDADLPDRPRQAVQLYVTRLRALLKQDGKCQLIVTAGDGYSIEVDAHQVDLGRFMSWREEARRAADEGNIDREAKALEHALAQWRGDPLADVPSELLQRETVPRLCEQWLEALDRRFALDQQHGRHAALISELIEVTAKHPLQERFWARLMTSLQASGRRADALEAYHTLRRSLAEQLGIDPSEELQALHAAILLGGTTSADGTSTVSIIVPRQIPPGVAQFTGRRKEIARLNGLLQSVERDGVHRSPVIAVVTGAPGVGKTVLATHWARQVADRFPDGQLWINLRGYDRGQAVPPDQVLTSFLRSLGVPETQIPSGIEDLVNKYRSVMDGRRVLVVLDNVRDGEQAEPLLPGSSGCMVLMTSRRPLSGVVAKMGAHPVILDLMNKEDARQLLMRRLGPDVATNCAAVDEVVDRCARLPLALAIAAARVATHPHFTVEMVGAELSAADGPVAALVAADPVLDISAVFRWSYDALSAGAARVFRLLALHPGPDITPRATAILTGIPLSQAQALLRELDEAHLVAEQTPGRFNIHDLLRDYATCLVDKHESEEERSASQKRSAIYYLATARVAADLIHPWEQPRYSPLSTEIDADDLRDYPQALAWFRAERLVLSALIQQAAGAGDPVYSWQLAASLVEFLYREGYWHDWIRTSSLALEQAVKHGERLAQARAHRSLARAHANMGDPSAAVGNCELGIELLEEIGDQAELAHAHRVYGVVLSGDGRHQEAMNHLRRSFDLYRCVDDAGDGTAMSGQANALNGIGWIHAMLGDYERSLASCEEALSTLVELGDTMGQALTWDSIGYAHHHLGRYERALACFHAALKLVRMLGATRTEAEILSHIGDSYHLSGRQSEADVAWKRALTIYTELGNRDARHVRAKLVGRSRDQALEGEYRP